LISCSCDVSVLSPLPQLSIITIYESRTLYVISMQIAYKSFLIQDKVKLSTITINYLPLAFVYTLIQYNFLTKIIKTKVINIVRIMSFENNQLMKGVCFRDIW